MRDNIGKHISKKFIGQYNQKILDHVKQSARNPFKTTSKRTI